LPKQGSLDEVDKQWGEFQEISPKPANGNTPDVGYNDPMDNTAAIPEVKAYTVAIPVYEGPLDLLLQLIERAELDITRVAIAQVTDQYLGYLNDLQIRSPDEVSAFLVIAARLIQIKSEALLPRPPVRAEGEEDPAEALAQQLRVYKQYKDISRWLGEREAAGLRTYLRLAPPPKVEAKIDLSGLGLEELVAAAESAFSRIDKPQEIGRVVVAPRVTIREKIILIVDSIRELGRSTFFSLIGKKKSRVDVIVMFLAVLELVKRRRVAASQDGLFHEIHLTPADGWDEDEEFELEFDD
jgi:segregation and condensation protein A